jgi:AcrR family transcriptional regulator
VGYHATSVRDIAKRVQVTVPALYYHHENKEAILVALLDRSIEAVIVLCRDALERGGDDPVARFSNLVECLVRFMLNSTTTAQLDAEIRSLSPESRREYVAKRHEIQSMLTDVLREGVRAGVFADQDPDETTLALLGMIRSVASWYRPGGRRSVTEIANAYVLISARAAGANPSVLGQIRAGQTKPTRRNP